VSAGDSDASAAWRRQAWDISKEDASKWAQKRRLADAMRLVIERLVPSNAPEEELRRAADALERYAEQLHSHPRLRYVHGFAESATAGDAGAFFDQSPMIGLANPLAPPIRLTQTGPRSAQGLVRFGSAYEGPPGHVHGGFVAAAFDEVLGYVQSLGGRPGMTGTLSVRYRSPTPLHTELRFEAELVGTEGRKILTRGRVLAAGRLCAEAEGIFVSVARERFAELEAQRAEREREREDGET
jgi:acyl-coenzyme A thioesterase PaaI-like protein